MVSIPVAQSAADLHAKLQTFREQSTYRAERIRLSEVDAFMVAPHSREQRHWQSQTNGDIARGDGRFFQVTGARISSTDGAIPTYEQPVLAEEENGFAALVYDKQTGDLLVDMKAEPGVEEARKHIAFAPTVQMSHARLQLAAERKFDKGPALLGALVGLGLDATKSTYVSQDGGRFWHKRNGYETLGVENKEAVAAYATPSMIWTSAAYLADAMNLGECNSHLVQCVGVHALMTLRK